MAEAERYEEGILLPVKRNSPIRCPLCLKEKRTFKSKICRDCDSWFLRNADGFYHNPSKITCPRNPDGGCGKTTCSSCRLSNFMALTGFCIENCPTNSCFFCNQITICRITNRVPQCSSCRKLFSNRSKKVGGLTQECSCINLSRKCPVCLVKKMIEVIGPRGTLGRPPQQMTKFSKAGQPFSQLDYEEASEMSDSSISEDLTEDEDELAHAHWKIRLDGIPFHCQEKAKLQVLSDCKVVLQKILPSNPMLGCKLDSSKRNGTEHLSLHRDYAAASTSLSVNSEDSEDVSAFDGKPSFLPSILPSFLNKLKEKYHQELSDPLEISPESGSQNQSTRPTSSPVIGCSNSGDESVTGIVSLTSSPVLRRSSANGSRKKKRYSNSNVTTPTSILPSTLFEDSDTSRTSVGSNSSMKRSRKTVDVGVQTDNRANESLERENAELRAIIKNLKHTLSVQSERLTLRDTIPSRSTLSPSTSTSTILSLSSPLPRAPCSPIICTASPLPTECAFPTVEPTDASPWCSSELVLPKPISMVPSSRDTSDAVVSHNASRRLQFQKVPQVVVHRLTEKDLMKYGVRNMRQPPSSSQKLTSGSSSGSKRHRSLFSDSSASDSEQPRVSSTNAVPVHDSSASSSKKKKLDSAHREVRVVSPNVTSGDKKGDSSKKSGDKEPKLQGDKNSKDSDKKNRVRRDSEKDKKKPHKPEEERKKEKEKRREKESEKATSKDKDAANKKTEKAKSTHSSSGKSKDGASAASVSRPPATKFKIPRVRQNSSPSHTSKAATQLEPDSILRADQHPGARLPVASAHFSTPGTVGLPPLLYESPPPPVQQTPAQKLPVQQQQPAQQPAQQPVQEYFVYVSPEKDVPVQAMEVAASERTALEAPVQPALPDSSEPVENINVRSTEGPKSLLRGFVPRSDSRKNKVTFADPLTDPKPQPRSYYDDLPDRTVIVEETGVSFEPKERSVSSEPKERSVSSEPKERSVSSEPKGTLKSTSKRRWFTGPSSQEDSSDAESSQEDDENSQSDADTENPAGHPEVTSAVSSSCDDVPMTPVKFPLGERLNNSPLRNRFNPEMRSSPTKTTKSVLSAKLSESTVRQTSPTNPTAMEIDEYVPQKSNSESLNDHLNLSEDSSSESDSSSSDDSDSLSSSPTKEDPSQNNSTPEPAQLNVKTTPPEASSALNESGTGSACHESEDEDDDILDLGLDDCETFGDELECEPSNPGPSVGSIQPAASTSKERPNTAHRTPSPPTANNVSVAPVKPRILQPSQDTINSAGLCLHFIGHGTCQYTPNCRFEHDANPGRVFSCMEQLCKSNLDRAIALMTHLTKKESPLHAELGKDWGRSISSLVILNLVSFDPRDDPNRRREFAQKRAEFADAALKLLVNPEVKCTADMCNRVIDRLAAIRSASLSTAVSVTRLYQRIDNENVEISSETWNKILKILTDVADWKQSLECLAAALKYFKQFRPNAISMEFLFRDALTKKSELVAICNLVKTMDRGGIKDLHPELKRDVISALDNCGLRDMCNFYRQQIFPDVFGGHVTDKIAPSQQPGLSQVRAQQQQHVLSQPGIPHQLPGPSQLRALQQPGPSQLRALQQPGPSQLRALQQPGPSQPRALQQPGPSQLRALQQPGPSQPRVPLSVPNQPVVHPGVSQHQQPPVPPFRPPNPTVPQAPPSQPPPPMPASLLRPPPDPLTPLSGPLVLTNENSSGNGLLKTQRGPNVAVEPSYELKEQLKQLYVAEDFDRIAQLFISYSLNDVNRSMVNDLLLLLKTLPVPSPGKFIANLFLNTVLRNGEGKPIPQHLRDALLELALSVLNLLFLNETNKFQEGYNIIVAVEFYHLNVFDYLEKKFIPPGVLLFAARCCHEMNDLGMALRFLISFHRTVKDSHVEDELIKLEADISIDVTMSIKEREEEIEEGEIAQSEEDVANLHDILELLEDYQNACEVNRTRFNQIKSARGWM